MAGSAARAARQCRRGWWSAVLRSAPIVLGLLLVGVQPARAWRVSQDGVPGPFTSDDFWNAVARAPSGDVFVAGVRIPVRSYDSCSYVVARLDGATGATRWRTATPSCGSDETLSRAASEQIFVDPSGDVIVARRGLDPERSFIVDKYAGDSGDVLWSRRVGGFPKHGPYVEAAALDPHGDVVVAAGLGDYTACTTTFVVAKLDGATGADLWRRTREGTFGGDRDDCSESLSHTMASGVAVDATGDVVAVGTIVDAVGEGSTFARHGVVVKLAGSDGSERWSVASPAASTAWRRAPVVIDARGDIMHVAESGRVVKRAGATGALVWSDEPADAAATNLHVEDLALGHDGTLAALGLANDAAAVAAIDAATGNERWQASLAPLSPNVSPNPHGVAVDDDGNVLVTATVASGGVRGNDVAIVSLAASDGHPSWRIELDGSAPDPAPYRNPEYRKDVAGGIVFGGGCIAVVASLRASGTNDDGITLLLSPSGDELWRAVPTHPADDGGSRVAVVPGGDVVALGGLEAPGNASKIVVTRRAAASGDELWTRTFPSAEWASVLAFGVDLAGDVILALAPAGRNDHFVLRKLSGARGDDSWSVDVKRRADGGIPQVEIARDGDAVVGSGKSGRAWVRRFAAADGHRLWARTIAGISGAGIVVDDAGDVLVHAQPDRGIRRVRKLDGTSGAPLWQAEVEADGGATLVADRDGNVLIGGQALVPPRGTTMIFVTKLDGRTGEQRWRTILGSKLDYGYEVRLTTTAVGDVLATASVLENAYADGGPQEPAKTIATKLLADSGASAWRRELPWRGEDTAVRAALASDAQGNLLIGGHRRPGGALAFALLQLAAADGAPGWRRAIPGTVGETGGIPFVVAIGIAADGDVVAVGSTATAETGADFTIVRWRPKEQAAQR